MEEYKELPMNEFYKRLSKASGLSFRAVKVLHKAYKKVYTDCMLNGESIELPAVGRLKLIPFDTELVRSPKTKDFVKRTSRYKFKFIPSSLAKRCRKVND